MRFGAVLVVLCCAANPVSGADKGDLILGSFDASSKASRLEIAADLKNTVEAFSGYVRYPTPKEDEWIERQRSLIEAATGDARSHQQLQLYRSTPLQLSKLRGLLDQLQASLRCILTAAQERAEMACWSIASFYLTDRTTLKEAVEILVRAGEIPTKALTLSLLRDTAGFASDYLSYGRGVLEYVVIPYLQKDATKRGP
jgi:hypothetical protein